eukprot:CAMPEP_0170577664 /NCGR_PEP_ID=MMETSP0224-20130122/5050_1 /TAXON_ID=285029 /ORGANISM="Togula jolla, Strain CCCM 725" /LENGTH=383 /DNA_ID=CAMNT_0010900595 /DNA_START=71 /DNA_END=1222 /DNA_ORIENTATION=-
MDVPAVVCGDDKAEKSTAVEFHFDDVPEELLRSFYAITFYRTSPKAVNLDFRVEDANGFEVLEPTSVELPSIGEVVNASMGLHGRRLSRRHHYSSRISARASLLRGQSGISRGSALVYGYLTNAALARNFPGGFEETEYGYSGIKAYEGAVSVPLASSAYLAVENSTLESKGFVYSRYLTYGIGQDQSCEAGTWKGPCTDCASLPSPSLCTQTFTPPEKALRDDLLHSVFSPKVRPLPMRLIVSSVEGEDYRKERICPPEGWRPNGESSVDWTPPPRQDIFVVLTLVVPKGVFGVSQKEQTEYAWLLALVVLSMWLVGCFPCFVCFLCYKVTHREPGDASRHGAKEQGYFYCCGESNPADRGPNSRGQGRGNFAMMATATDED